MILEASETMRAMAEIYDIPQLAFLVRRIVLTIGTSHDMKRYFS